MSGWALRHFEMARQIWRFSTIWNFVCRGAIFTGRPWEPRKRSSRQRLSKWHSRSLSRHLIGITELYWQALEEWGWKERQRLCPPPPPPPQGTQEMTHQGCNPRITCLHLSFALCVLLLGEFCTMSEKIMKWSPGLTFLWDLPWAAPSHLPPATLPCMAALLLPLVQAPTLGGYVVLTQVRGQPW